MDLRYRQKMDREDKDQEAWGSDASELMDTSMEDGSPVAPDKVLKL